MQKNKFRASYIIVIILVGILTFSLGFSSLSNLTPISVYKVYIEGELIGTLSSEEDFYEYINKKDEEIKSLYNVNQVYVPNDVVIKEVITYDSNTNTNEEIYNKIIELKQFTIKGTIITIDASNTGTATGSYTEDNEEEFDLNKNTLEDDVKKEEETDEKIYIYVTDKSIFDEAVTKLIKSFVDEEDYNKYINGEQEEITETGSIIKDIDIYEDVTYTKGYISIDEQIFTNTDDLAMYLLYGTTEEQESYIVKEGDTIASIAESNKLNTQEFLLANPNFKSENTLLYEGQEVNVGLINPIISIVVEINDVSDEERNYSIDIQYDESELQNVEYVLKEGENGLYRVNREYQYINGQLSATQTLGSIELEPTVNKIIVKGSKEIPSVADLSYWAWPTETPYSITTYYGYRWGSMHAAIDISGPGYGSNVYAANNGVIIEIGSGCIAGNISCNGRRGNYIVINHNNANYYTVYMHLASITVSVGDTVSRGQKIGTMGNSGEVYPTPSSSCAYCGTHLHFAVFIGRPYYGGTAFDPLTLY